MTEHEISMLVSYFTNSLHNKGIQNNYRIETNNNSFFMIRESYRNPPSREEKSSFNYTIHSLVELGLLSIKEGRTPLYFPKRDQRIFVNGIMVLSVDANFIASIEKGTSGTFIYLLKTHPQTQQEEPKPDSICYDADSEHASGYRR